ncbi:glycosyltransferase family 2 protein [Candidatus Gracilibacteria bacterium]|nr:glycosyltransferase family 2 protein [Candidatus Gracilibacteria bacterium]
MKLIIQIPCYNEEQTLRQVLEELPKEIPEISKIETMIIDDGSRDKTIEIAETFGVNHIVKHRGNMGLGNAFQSGVSKALLEGADILVNTDGDNQYPGKYIADLVKPIIEKHADFVMGDRQTSTIQHFSILKKFFQWLGSLLVRFFSGTNVPDSVSGFRAYSREALFKLNVTSDFSYAVDTLVQAGSKKIKIAHVPITTNKPTRPSRLFSSMWQHMTQTLSILLRVYAMYHPMKLFFTAGSIFGIIGILGILRFLYFYITIDGNTGRVQSLILSGTFLTVATIFFALGIIGDLISKNRKLIEDQLYITKKMYYNKTK